MQRRIASLHLLHMPACLRLNQVVLGGVALHPVVTKAGANDTGALFNWHPVMMTLGFGVLMAEALLAYRAPLLPWLTRCGHRSTHACMHAVPLCHVAALCVPPLGWRTP